MLLFGYHHSSVKRTKPCRHSLIHSCSSSCLLVVVLVLIIPKGWAQNSHRREMQSTDDDSCVCPIFDLPDLTDKEATARWMVHSLEWGVLSTISTRLTGDGGSPIPFGNVYSFVDGPCNNGTGTPYFYGAFMDQSFADVLQNPMVSLTLSEAGFSQLQASCWKQQQQSSSASSKVEVTTTTAPFRACRIAPNVFGDPENPVCARLTLTGRFEILKAHSAEWLWAVDAFFHRHPSMSDWPEDHQWQVAAIRLQDVWLLDYFGGPSVIKVEDYYKVKLTPPSTTSSSSAKAVKDDWE